MNELNTGVWTGPTIAQLLVTALTPLAVVALGWHVTRAAKKLETLQWASQAVVTRRLDIFESIAPKLNALLCFYTFVGTWKEITPQRAIELKREVDETVYSRQILFSAETLRAYQALMSVMFAMYTKTNSDAPLRARIFCDLGDRRNLPWWQSTMEQLFAESDVPSEQETQAAYETFLDVLRHDLYVTRAEIAS